MQFNPVRQLFKWDGKLTIRVNHVISPEHEYGQVTMDESYNVRVKVTFKPSHPMMDNLLEELHRELQRYANTWKWFFRPQALMKSFVKNARLEIFK
jgi:cell division inhibitor SulA